MFNVYTVGYIDYINNELYSSESINESIIDAINDINLIITSVINKKFDIYVQKKYIFHFKDDNDNEVLQNENKLKINNTDYLLLIRSENHIDVFYYNINKGYVYNSGKLIHNYKFYINKHNYMGCKSDVCSDNSNYVYSKKLNGMLDKNITNLQHKLILELKERLKLM